MSEGFFRKATPQEHEAVVRNERKQVSLNLVACKKHSDKIKNDTSGFRHRYRSQAEQITR